MTVSSKNPRSDNETGQKLHNWAQDLFPICRSITGPGVRETLKYLQSKIPALKIQSVPSGTTVFDWQIPDEWFIYDAYIENKEGIKIIDFKKNNLHIVGYSQPIDKWMSLAELNEHLYSLVDQPNAIPYVTSYYHKTWGFCLTHEQRNKLQDTDYHVIINAELKPGVLNYGELFIQGKSTDEILLSTYICHPSMANNELSGPIVTTAIAQWLDTIATTQYSYRILFLPETIGSITYLSQHAETMKKHTIAGFVLSCLGDDRDYSYLPSKYGNTLADNVAQYVLSNYTDKFSSYSFLDRGSDERQYNAAGIDLPVCSVMRSKYGEYSEYHTSLDDLSLITPSGLQGGYEIIKKILQVFEKSQLYKNKINCEPQLGKRNLYPTLSIKNNSAYSETKIMLNILAYLDGKTDLLSIAQIIKTDFFIVAEIAELLENHNIIERL